MPEIQQSISVKKVTKPAELKAAFRIREEVFILEQEVDRSEEFDEFEDISIHFIAFCGSEPAGTARWRKTNKGIKLERFAVRAQFRGKRIGYLLVEKVLEDIRESMGTGHHLYLHAQSHVVPLYRRFGFEAYGPEFMECNIPHFAMKLDQ